MSFGADCLINKLNTNITGLGADNQTSLDFAQLGGALNSLENSFCSVATINDLPAACDNEGRFIYVTACRSFRYSDGYEWLMNACSVFGNINQVNQLWSWGTNICGTLGDGTIVSRSSPGTVAGAGTNWCDITNRGAIKTDGTLWTWGSNGCGRLGDGTTTSRSSPGTVAGGGTNWCQVCFKSAIKTDGTLWTWGENNSGKLGDGTVIDRCSPGTVAGGGTNWCQVSGSSHTAALKTDGTIWTWGSNFCGGLGDGTTVSRCSPGTIWGSYTTWCQISAYCAAISAIKCDGTLWTWGYNNFGKLGNGTVLNRCSPGTVAGGGTDWCKVSTGFCHSAAIKCDGTLWTWGENTFGQLGTGTANLTCRSSPGTVAGGGTNWCQVSIGVCQTAAIKTDGTIWTWGRNSTAGLLGDGTTLNRCSPGTVAGGGTNWWKVMTLEGTFALKSRGF